MDSTTRFVRAQIVYDYERKESIEEIHRSYAQYCLAAGEKLQSRRRLVSRIKSAFSDLPVEYARYSFPIHGVTWGFMGIRVCTPMMPPDSLIADRDGLMTFEGRAVSPAPNHETAVAIYTELKTRGDAVSYELYLLLRVMARATPAENAVLIHRVRALAPNDHTLIAMFEGLTR